MMSKKKKKKKQQEKGGKKKKRCDFLACLTNQMLQNAEVSVIP